MDTILLGLKETLSAIKHPILCELEKPLKRSKIEQILDFDKLGKNDEYIALYENTGWVHGSKLMNENYVEFSSFGCLLDFSDATSLYYLKKKEKYLFKKMPFITNKDGAFVVVDLDEKGESYGKLFACPMGDFLFETSDNSVLITIYDSVKTFIQTVDECYKQGAYKLNGRLLDIDSEKERNISRKLNPKSVYWK